MTEAEFDRLAGEGYNRIPLVLETFADLDTPLSLYLKLANRPDTYLLESVVGGERFGRYSFIGLAARTRLRAAGERTEVVRDGQTLESHTGNPLEFIAGYLKRFRAAPLPGLPRFSGGLAGYFGYDTVRYIEPRLGPSLKPDPLGTPDILLLQTDELVVVDNLKGKISLIVHADPALAGARARAEARLHELRRTLRRPLPLPLQHASRASGARTNFERPGYLAAVARAKRYILDGDMMQVQLGQRIAKPYTDSPLSLYRALRSINPSPYMYYYHFGDCGGEREGKRGGDFHVVGASPEILVLQEQGEKGTTVTIRPLAGTRPRGVTPDEDQALGRELLADPKEIAEHVMLIDLARNDIGRIAETGSVRVPDKMVIERYSHVMHIVSNVEGRLAPGMSALDVLRATFPAGTLTGAPKVRAMEIIDELEPEKRGIYGGAVGYLNYQGDMDLAIAIRTGVVKDGVLYAQAAAGIVADSVPENEWTETENKARAILRAAEMVQAGLDEED
ncbi:MAG: anthranilate synthase component I [Burkholderiales bacterium]|nr:anthranilate synthase component I [Burkholderiales bacterium]